MRSLALILMFAGVGQMSTAQTRPTKPVTIDPGNLLDSLRSANGLSFEPPSSWHILLTWDQYDRDGDNDKSGSIEEFYVDAHKYKIVITSEAAVKTEIANDSGLYISDGKWPTVRELQAIDFVLDPLKRVDEVRAGLKAEQTDKASGSITLTCLSLVRKDIIYIGPPTLCFDIGTTRLRFASGPGIDGILYNNLRVFQGRNFAEDVTATIGGKPILKVHVETLDSPTLDDALFESPSGQTPLSGRIAIPSSLLVIEKRGEMESVAGQQGTVTVSFVVGRDGKVIETRAVGGSSQLQKSAVRTMRNYKFRPFLLLDKPIEVEGTMEFNFN